MHTKTLILSTALLGVTLGAYAADDASKGKTAATPAVEPANGANCVFARTVNDWQVIDDKTIAVWAPSRKTPYIVTLYRATPGLRFQDQLGFEDHNNDARFCDYGGDSVVVGGAFPERIPIAAIRRTTADEIKQLVVQAKEAQGNRKTVKPPEQSDMKSDQAGAQPPAEKPPQ